MRPRVVAALATLWMTNALGASDLEVGFSKSEITPDIIAKPVYLAGFGHNRIAKSIHQPIFVRSIVLRHGNHKIAIASVDVVGLFLPFVEKVRKQLPGYESVLITSTHNHHGPDTMGLWGPTPFQSGVDSQYMNTLETKIVACVRGADANAVAVTAAIGSTSIPELLHDSRLPEIKHDVLIAITFRELKTNKPAGAVVQWNCHPETMSSKNTQLSPDFVGSLCNTLGDRYQVPVLYLTGTVGGLMTSMHVPVFDGSGRRFEEGSIAKTEKFGELLAQRTISAMDHSVPITMTPFDVRTRSVILPVDNPRYKLARSIGLFDRELSSIGGRPAIHSEISRMRLGDLDIAVIPGEIYPELILGKVQDPAEPNADFPAAPMEPGLYAQMSGKHKMIIGLGNDELGYIIPKRQWDEKSPFCYGLKKPPYGEVNSLGPDTGPILCEEFQKMLKD